jgi:hypothetical protein
MAENNESGTTTVTQVDLDIDNILGTPGAENIMLPSGEEKKPEPPKPNLFTSKPVDLSFLDNADEDDSDDSSSSADAGTPAQPAATKSNDEINQDLDSFSNPEADKGGRPKMSKDGMIEFTKKLIEKGIIVPFETEDGKEEDLTKYSIKDFEELFDANLQEKERKMRNQIPVEFFQQLPEELQVAAKYVSDGGQDLKGLFRTLAQVEEVRQLDPENEYDQENIVRAYLTAKNPDWTTDEIEEEIVGWKDRDELAAKAQKLKPKLDAMQQQVVAHRLQQQEQMRQQQQQQAQMYMNNVYKVLDPGDLNGLKLDKKTQSMLYAGLVQPNYPSISGRQTNLLGHLLEKYQYVEPRHDLIAEALWLLSDPDGYRSKVKESGKKEATEKTVRMLKTEQATKVSSSNTTDADDDKSSRPTQRLQRPNPNFFKR